MYKTISINNNTYQNLQAIASKMAKPKAQIVDELVRGYVESVKEEEKRELQDFNKFVATLAKRMKLPKGVKINTGNLDKDFAVLRDL